MNDLFPPRTETCPSCGMNHAADVRKKNATQERIRNYRRKLKSLQARIDELMFEHCPDEMTAEQYENWESHQVKSDLVLPETDSED